MLIDQDGVTVWIEQHQTGGAAPALVGFLRERQTLRLESALVLAYVSELFHWLSVLVPARIERQDIALKHVLEESDRNRAVAENKPVLRWIAANDFEVEFFIELSRSLQVLYGQADRERTKCRGLFHHAVETTIQHGAGLAKSCEV